MAGSASAKSLITTDEHLKYRAALMLEVSLDLNQIFCLSSASTTIQDLIQFEVGFLLLVIDWVLMVSKLSLGSNPSYATDASSTPAVTNRSSIIFSKFSSRSASSTAPHFNLTLLACYHHLTAPVLPKPNFNPINLKDTEQQHMTSHNSSIPSSSPAQNPFSQSATICFVLGSLDGLEVHLTSSLSDATEPQPPPSDTGFLGAGTSTQVFVNPIGLPPSATATTKSTSSLLDATNPPPPSDTALAEHQPFSLNDRSPPSATATIDHSIHKTDCSSPPSPHISTPTRTNAREPH
ncbi:hypothetical protein Pst134EA_032518 [Puccinia striiformis f. sp. tritici]|uniref:uncharacterized protein n=1 Tax=Puccinia striiformis f. sp. tritici TaxID=168172 RepID=UPI00200797B8|nr:uncharacterized protein Pst134EA_032518 [Puccinia striiformis f. sp. tritici]KAH9441724.1 hypothetical protein Pst134EA_032518 [Puccinia striiformis f. sp. tritici]